MACILACAEALENAIRQTIANNAVVRMCFISALCILFFQARSCFASSFKADTSDNSCQLFGTSSYDSQQECGRAQQMCADAGEVTILLKAMQRGDTAAADKLLPLVYKELHRLAKSYMRRERPDHTLQPTALIHEAYIRLVGNDTDWQNHEHFIGVAANVMRRVLVDHARAHNAGMRGGDFRRVELDEGIAVSNDRSNEVLAVDEALEEFKKENPRQAQIVELRYFAGLSIEQIAALLEISPRSVQRDWSSAKEWLFERLR